MARVPYTGVPESEPPLEQPQDQIRVQANPAAFGAPLAEGAEALGHQALDLSKFYGQVAADDSTNNLLDQATKLLHGDPSQHATDANGQPILDANGQPMPDTGFFGKTGADAMRAAPDVQARLDEIIRDQRENLTSPMARQQFDVESRRYRAQYMTQIGTYTDSQTKVYAKDTNDNLITTNLNRVGLNPADDATAGPAQSGQAPSAGDLVRQSYVRNAQLSRGESATAAILKANQEIAATRIRSAIGSNDGALADRLFKDPNVGGTLASTPGYDQIARQVSESLFSQQFAPAVHDFMGGVTADAQGQSINAGTPGHPSSIDAVANAVGHEEWRGTGPAPVSPRGAVGNSQIMPATAREHGLDPDRLTDPAYAAMAKKKILSDIAALPNVQGDPARMAVGYFSGEANIAPPGSPTPWKRNTNDGHEDVATYVANTTSHMAQYPNQATAIAANQTQIMDRAQAYAEQKWPNRPDWQDRFVQTIGRRTDQQISELHRQYDVDTQVVQGAMLNHPISVEDMTQDPTVAAAWQRLQTENPIAARGVETLFDSNAHGVARTYGTGFKAGLDRALGDRNDPGFIGNPAQVWPYVGKGEDAIFTNTGAQQLAAVMALRSGPNGEANASAIKTFVDSMHGNMTFSNAATGVYDEKGEARYAKFMAVALPVIEHAAKAGTLSDVLNPQSKNYVGQAAAPFMRSGGELRRDQLAVDNPLLGIHHPLMQGPALTVQTLGPELARLDNDRQRSEAVIDWLKAGRLNLATYNAWHQANVRPGPQTGQFMEPPKPSVTIPPGGQ